MKKQTDRVWTLALCGLVLTSGVMVGAAPVGQYEVTDKVARDRRTGLVWQRNLPTGVRTYEEAKKYCEEAQPDSYNGWRLPTVAELQTIVDVRAAKPAVDKAVFTNILSQLCWTSTPYIGAAEPSVWAVSFAEGNNRDLKKTAQSSVVCVR